MFRIDYATEEDKAFWFTLEQHMDESEFWLKVRDKRAYIISDSEKPVGIMRYNLFWDNAPCLTMLYLVEAYRKKGFGAKAMAHWENEMRRCGYKFVITTTQVDEAAQHFYRRLGYKDAGGFLIEVPSFEQPMEMFMIKLLT